MLCISYTSAQSEFVDVILDAWYSGANPSFNDFYGNDSGGCPHDIIPLTAILGDSDSLVALPTGSYIVAGFTDNIVYNAENQADLFIEEIGAASEFAELHVSSDNVNFTYLGIVNGGTTSAIDLEDFNYQDIVTAVMIVGLDAGGCIPGFDVVRIFGLPGANCSAEANVDAFPLVCEEMPSFNLNEYVDLSFSGKWEGNFVNGSEFNVAAAGIGIYEIQYIVNHDIQACFNDTAFVQIEVTSCDCNQVPNGIAILDECGVCLDPSNPNFNQSCLDCAGIVNGPFLIDECGDCLETDDPLFNQSCADCAGVPNGLSIIDACDVCLEPTDPEFDQSCFDCMGILDGPFVLDECGVCLEPTDPEFNQACADCAGVPNGLAIIDYCGECYEPTDPMFNNTCPERFEVFIPNIFSPNNDGTNDLFQVYMQGGLGGMIKVYDIYDRWGNVLYSRRNFPIDSFDEWWNGRHNGETILTNVYTYNIVVEYATGEERSFVGTITLLN